MLTAPTLMGGSGDCDDMVCGRDGDNEAGNNMADTANYMSDNSNLEEKDKVAASSLPSSPPGITV